MSGQKSGVRKSRHLLRESAQKHARSLTFVSGLLPVSRPGPLGRCGAGAQACQVVPVGDWLNGPVCGAESDTALRALAGLEVKR